MDSFSTVLAEDHRRCDELFARAEERVARNGCADARNALADFTRAMARHLRIEEEVLFPAFEARTGMTLGPTAVMREEHVQMRELFEAMADALAQDNKERYLGLSETLLILMQQHNLKEEQVLYQMADQMLAAERPRILAAVNEALNAEA